MYSIAAEEHIPKVRMYSGYQDLVTMFDEDHLFFSRSRFLCWSAILSGETIQETLRTKPQIEARIINTRSVFSIYPLFLPSARTVPTGQKSQAGCRMGAKQTLETNFHLFRGDREDTAGFVIDAAMIARAWIAVEIVLDDHGVNGFPRPPYGGM